MTYGQVTLSELGRWTKCAGLCACVGACRRDGYISLGGERMWVFVEWGYIVEAETAPLAFYPYSASKWYSADFEPEPEIDLRPRGLSL